MLHSNYPALVPISTYYSLIGAVVFVSEMFVILVRVFPMSLIV